MSTVHHNHLKSGTFRQGCCLFIRSNNVCNQGFCQGFYFYSVWTDSVGRSPLMHAFLSVLVGHVGSSIHSGMGKFNTRDRTMTADRICGVSRRCQRIQDRSIQMICMRTICFRVHHALTDSNSTCAALASQLIKSCRFRSYATVICDICSAHRCRKHTITKSYSANL